MKLNRLTRRCVCHLAVTVVGGNVAFYSIPAIAEVRGAEQLLQHARKLERDAQEPEAGTQKEEPKEAPREAEKENAEARRAANGFARGNPEAKEQLAAMQRELDELKGELKELLAAGKEDEATEVKEHILKRERELERRKEEYWNAGPENRRRSGPRVERREQLERERMEPRPPGDRPQPPQEMPELHRRLHHLQAAIDNLHAAGLHEPAERLAREAERMRQQLRAAPVPPPGPETRSGPGMRPGRRQGEGEMAPLREEIRKLQEAMQELRRRVDELSRERR